MVTPFFYGQASEDAVQYPKTAGESCKHNTAALTDVKEIVPLITFLVREGSRITGRVILANGGRHDQGGSVNIRALGAARLAVTGNPLRWHAGTHAASRKEPERPTLLVNERFPPNQGAGKTRAPGQKRQWPETNGYQILRRRGMPWVVQVAFPVCRLRTKPRLWGEPGQCHCSMLGSPICAKTRAESMKSAKLLSLFLAVGAAFLTSSPSVRAFPLEASPPSKFAVLNALTPEQLEILNHLSIVELDDGQGGTVKTIRVTGANFQLVNGLGSTATTNGTGNLIVGYNELGNPDGDDRTGSHNLVGGSSNSFSSFGGLVVGRTNTASGNYSSVSGGVRNKSTNSYASVSGGSLNEASGNSASVSGGQNNTAYGSQASISGGFEGMASGVWSSVSGGEYNTATGNSATVGGGQYNTASGRLSAVSGGISNVASNTWSSVSGGSGNNASGQFSSVSGGASNTAYGSRASVTGGFGNFANGAFASVSGGQNNTAGGNYAVVSGGRSNTASANRASVSGGLSRSAAGAYNWVAGSLLELN